MCRKSLSDTDLMTSRWARTPSALAALCAVASLSACGSDSDPAVWTVAPNQSQTPASTEFTAIVSRVRCGGAKHETVEPTIEADRSAITITFRMKPKVTGDALCAAETGIAYQVHLDEPIGTCVVVDGECHDGSIANGTSACLDHGLRLTWHNGQAEVNQNF
jgi:hypothetical protein